jgi:cytochrome P450
MLVSVPEAVMFNPFDPAFFVDPYSQYRELREREPVHHSPMGNWMLFRYDDAVSVLRDPKMSVDVAKATPTLATQMFEEMLGDRETDRRDRAMLNLDPPDHDRLRRLVAKAFNPRMIEALRPRVQQLVDEYLDAVAARGEMDVIADLAFPLPFTVISEMLGMPEGDRQSLREWSHALTKTLDPIITPDDVEAAFQASDLMSAHVESVVAAKRREPADDLLSALIAAEDEGDMLTEEELLAQVVLLYIAGHETTVNLIGNATLAMLSHPDQLARLRADPSLDAGAVEELLRYDSPVQFSRRITLAPIEIDGHDIDTGSFVLTCLGSANRDPDRWGVTADELDLSRGGAAQHVSFGGGVHHCLGAFLARLEAQVAVPTLVRRFPALELVDDHPAWNGRVVLRGLDRLPVRLGS